MLAPKLLPPEFKAWNRRHDAPFGRLPSSKRTLQPKLPLWLNARLFGPFSVQSNNTLRTYEYPWAASAGKPQPGQRVVEIGGGLSGFQFVLAQAGCRVVNVDPGMEAKGVGWPCDETSMKCLNRAFGTDVELRNTTVSGAALEVDTYDCAFCLSVLEHLPLAEAQSTCEEVYRALRPGGLFVITLDLFLDIAPFTSRTSNKYGQNLNAAQLASFAPFTLHSGNRAELFGYPEFDAQRIQAALSDYLVGSYPALAQCMVLRK